MLMVVAEGEITFLINGNIYHYCSYFIEWRFVHV